MITVRVPEVPSLPLDPVGVNPLFEAELHRSVAELHLAASRRKAWMDSLTDVEVTSTPNRRRHGVLARRGGTNGVADWPWRFNVTADGNGWWPSFSRAVVAEEDGASERGRLATLAQPYVGGQPFDSVGPASPSPLSPGARTFWLKFTLSDDPEYHAGDTFRPGIPVGAVEVTNLALGALPSESRLSIWVPWVDVPPAAPPAPRRPTYHFALWFRFSFYWHAVEDSSSSSDGSSSSKSKESSSSQPPSSESSSGKPIVL